ncbi:MAG TPA: hypothetical protein VKG45_05065 [Actinomycetes bacterium]|nr:hypothetical protein [Actinomycetes bacterium]
MAVRIQRSTRRRRDRSEPAVDVTAVAHDEAALLGSTETVLDQIDAALDG